jgi:hypothetical protein
MSYCRLGDAEQARNELNAGIQAMEETCPTMAGPTLKEKYLPERWIVWSFLHVIQREAEATILESHPDGTERADDL